MRTHLLDEHIRFFQEHHSIELEGLFSEKDLSLFEQALNALHPQKNNKRGLDPIRPGVRHDVWRSIAPCKKIISHKGLCEAVSRLQDEKPLRIGYDRYFPGGTAPASHPTASLSTVSSLRPLVCGALIALRDANPQTEETFFPQKKGNVLFLHPDLEIPWQRLQTDQTNDYYLIVYVGAKTSYARNAQDPFAGAFIQSGYSSGDRLSDAKNPVVY